MYDLTSPKQTSELLRSHGIRLQKRLGQNFLCDRNILNNIVASAKLTPNTPVLEVGAGAGALTTALADHTSRLTSIEIDTHLEPILREVTADYENINLVFQDFMRMDMTTLFDSAFGEERGVFVSNIPYYITTPIIEKLIEHKHRWRRAVMLVQQEVANRIVAKPATPDFGSMSLFVQYHTKPEIICKVPPTVFLPAPDVSSCVIALEPIIPGAITIRNEARMFRLIRAGFGQRRKTLLNALMRAPDSFNLGFGMEDRARLEEFLAKVGIDGNRRGETLSLEEYGRLSDAYEAD